MSMTRKGRHPLEFRRMAVERMKRCENIVALSEELGGEPGGAANPGAANPGTGSCERINPALGSLGLRFPRS